MSKFDFEIDRLKNTIEANQGAIERIVNHMRNGIMAEEPVLKRLVAANEEYNRIIERFRQISEGDIRI